MWKTTLMSGLFLSGLLVGCTQPTATSGVQTAALPEAVPVRYNEFIYCSKGPNYSPEGLANNLGYWADSMQNTLQLKTMAAASLTPRGWTNGDFDRLHLMMWPDKATRDAGWAAYAESGLEEAEAALFPGLEKCGGENWQSVFAFNVYQPRPTSVSLNPEDSPVVGYRFCKMNEGKVRNDLRMVIRNSFIPYLDELEVAQGPSAYQFFLQAPDFDVESQAPSEGVPASWDYMWTNLWPNAAAYESTIANWSVQGQALQAEFDAVATCSAEQPYDLSPIMAASE